MQIHLDFPTSLTAEDLLQMLYLSRWILIAIIILILLSNISESWKTHDIKHKGDG